MTAGDRICHVFLCVICILATYAGSSLATIDDLNSENIDTFLKGKLLTIIFIDSPSSPNCRIVYPFFVAASQVFPNDQEVFFARTYDSALIKQWEVTDTPAVVYHRIGSKNIELLNIDVTVDSIIDEIIRLMNGNFANLKRTYSVKVNDKNFAELIETPQQYVLMFGHDKGDHNEREVIEKLAYSFRKDDAIVIASLNVSTQSELQEEVFKTKDTPIVIWYFQNNKTTPRRFGGELSQELLTEFVNEQTVLQRNLDGSLMKEAGRIPAADDIIDNHITAVMEGKPEEMQPVIQLVEDLLPTADRHHIEMLEYYLYILENIVVKDDDVPVRNIFRKLDRILATKEDLSEKQKDIVSRKRNIIAHFENLERTYFKARETHTKLDMELELLEKKNEKEAKKEEQETDIPIDEHEEL